MKAGVKQEKLMFLFTDNQIADERFLVYMNDLLSSGNIPDLFAKDEKDNIVSAVETKAKAAGYVRHPPVAHTAVRPPPTAHRAPRTAQRASPTITPLTTHHSPLTAYRAPLTAHYHTAHHHTTHHPPPSPLHTPPVTTLASLASAGPISWTKSRPTFT